ncbi:MAG: DNA replication/repair protein RecF [Halieaceae bacterium]|nr:DNA replication/repair protein RecF [Halieaceae bacterium]
MSKLLRSLTVQHYRNLSDVSLDGLGRHTLLFGENGSGKTSLLEAVHILGTARSFRSGKPRSQIQHGEERYVIHGRVARGGLGVQRSLSGEVILRVARETVRSAARLADELPLLVINASSFDLLTGEPAQRRRLLDWGVFHVEHQDRETFPRFQRALGQRNQLLRRDRIDRIELEGWTRELAAQGSRLAAARERFLQALADEFAPVQKALAPELGSIELRYRQGWDSSQAFFEALERGADSDREQGFTQVGPQRADIRIQVDGYPAADTLSRGQQKLLVIALKLAQGRLFARDGSALTYLVDDLPSELDRERCEKVCRLFRQLRVQTLITGVERSSIPDEWLKSDGEEVGVFHVEHGSVVKVDAR